MSRNWVGVKGTEHAQQDSQSAEVNGRKNRPDALVNLRDHEAVSGQSSSGKEQARDDHQVTFHPKARSQGDTGMDQTLPVGCPHRKRRQSTAAQNLPL